MRYDIAYRKQATTDLIALSKDDPKAFRKVNRLIEELREHPRTGTGKPEPLSANRTGQWSRRINRKHRLVYEIHDSEIIVIVISAYGHYEEH